MQKHLVAISITLACWTFAALLFTPQTYLINLRAPTPLTLWQALVADIVLFYLWALLTPFVLWLGRRFSLERPHFLRNFAILFLLSFPTALLHIFLLQQTNFLFLNWMRDYQSPVPIMALLVGLGATNVMVYWGILAISQAINYFRRYRAREQSLAQAQLQALKTQLHPHFLFNTLNAISELVYEDAAEAEQTIAKLSEMLRFSLKSGQAQEVSLREELEFTQIYIEIQQTLLQERLKVKWQIAPETLAACVPNMILQPLIENSIRHGIATRISGGTVEIGAERKKNWLLLHVKDDGIGFALEQIEKGDGIGLPNTRTRLKHLYGDNQEFIIEKLPDEKGVSVTVKIPFIENKKYDSEDSHFDS